MVFINSLFFALFCCFIVTPLISCFHRDDSLLRDFDADSMDKSSSGKDQDISCRNISKEPSESLFCCTSGDSDLQKDSVEKLALLREKRTCSSDTTMPVSLKNKDISQSAVSGTAIWDITSNNTQNNITDSVMNKTNIEHSLSNLTSTTTSNQNSKNHEIHLNTTDSAINTTVPFTNFLNSSSNSSDENSNTSSTLNITSNENSTLESSSNINTTYDDSKCHNETIPSHNMTSNKSLEINDEILNESCVDGFAASEDHSETPTEISKQNNHNARNTTKSHNHILSGDASSNNPILYYLFSLSLLITCIVS